MKAKPNVAVVGATGAVGEEMLKVLEERDFPVGKVKLLSSARSAGRLLTFRRTAETVEELGKESFKGVDIALFSAGGDVSREYAPVAAAAGAVVVDNSSAWRMDPEVPLVVPEVNPDVVGDRPKGIIANPNCSTIQMVVVLKPLHDAAEMKRVVVSTYQSVSGTGWKAMDELRSQSAAVLADEPVQCEAYPHQIAFNVLPHIDVFMEGDYTKEEIKMVQETRKIMGLAELRMTATTARVPVFVGHSESVNVEFQRALAPEEARRILAAAPGVAVVDDPAKNEYPLALGCAGRDETFVGRIRADDSVRYGLNLWIVSDNLRKGAATNAVQIAELLL